MKKGLSVYILLCFLITSIIGPNPIYAQEIRLPVPGVMVRLSPKFNPPILKGIKVYPDNPFRLDFILDKGNSSDSIEQLRIVSTRMIKYFLASITVPEKNLWVNLSPYEKDRIIPEAFGVTEMGRDLLAQDYILKQITASMIYPEGQIGKEFWGKVYAQAQKQYGKTDVQINTFNKVWIVPQKAVVYENKESAYVVESRLKVMLEQDYLSLKKHEGIQSGEVQIKDTNQLGSKIVREIVIPILEKEVNEGKNFVQLRQVYNSLILAVWFKDKVKESLLGKAYVDQNKTSGIDIEDKGAKNKIWAQYVKAFKKGAYNYIKEDYDPVTRETVPRKYFSGGAAMNHIEDPGVYKREDAKTGRGRLPKGVLDGAMVVQIDMAMTNKDVADKDKAMKIPKRLKNLMQNTAIRRLVERADTLGLSKYILGLYKQKTDSHAVDAVLLHYSNTGNAANDIERAVQDAIKNTMYLQNDSQEYDAMRKEDVPVNVNVKVAQQILDETFPQILGRSYPYRLKDVLFIRLPHPSGADGLSGHIFICTRQYKQKNSPVFVRLLVHEALHLVFEGDAEFRLRGMNELTETLVEYLTDQLMKRSGLFTDWKGKNRKEALGYHALVENFREVVIRALFQRDDAPFIAFLNDGDIGKLANRVLEALQRIVSRKDRAVEFKNAAEYPVKALDLSDTKLTDVPYNKDFNGLRHEMNQLLKLARSEAMMAPGGIDLTRDKMGLQIQGEGHVIQFKFDPAMTQQLRNSTGLTPVVINIQPITVTVPMFLGIDDSEELKSG